MLTATDITSIVLSTVQFVIGLPCNALTIAVYVRRKPQTTITILIIYRAIVDIVAVSILAPISIISTVSDTDSWLCSFTIFLKDAMSYSLLVVGVVVAYDRFVVFCKASNERSSKKRGLIVITSSISTSLLLSMPGTIIARWSATSICEDISQASSVADAWIKTGVFVASVIACLILYGLVYMSHRKHARGRPRKLSTIREGRRRRWLFGKRAQTRESVTSTSSRCVHVKIEPAPPTMTTSFIHSEIHSEAEYSATSQRATTTEIQRKEVWLHPRPLSIHKSATPPQRLKFSQSSRAESTRASTSTGRRNRASESSAVSPMLAMNKPCKQSRSISVSAMISSSTANVQCDHRRRVKSAGVPNTSDDRDTAYQYLLAKEQQTTVMMFAATIFLMVSWIPAIVFYHVDNANGSPIDEFTHQNTFMLLITRLPLLNHFVTCFIYALTSTEFRQDTHNIIRRLMCCGRQRDIQIEI